MEENPSDSDTNPFRYCGEYYDIEIGQIYLRARYYDPAVGRFTQSDPARDGSNWYVYCSNNPINYKDPTGYWEEGDELYPEIIQEALKIYTDMWIIANANNDPIGMAMAHEYAESARILGDSMVSRDEWGAKQFENKWGNDPYKNAIVIHHTDNNDSVKDIEKAHVKKGYGDIGYHFIIGKDGKVYEGTPIDYKGAHVEGANTGKIGVALIGDYSPDIFDGWDRTPPPDEQIISMIRLIAVLQDVYGIYGVNMHKDYNDTKCPGDVVEEILERMI